jgi:cyclophilin family peptidyl-prolyl cis-trans isomerase/protein-disulfide isomerase
MTGPDWIKEFMQRISVFIIILFVTAAVSACSPQAAPGELTPASTPAAGIAAMATSGPAVAEVAAPAMECQVVSIAPTPGPTEDSMFPPPQAEDWIQGSADATLTITEYSDFQCPYCSMLAADLKKLVADHPEDVRVVFRHFPLQSHPLARLAASAAEAAGEQGNFWEMHDLIFSQQQAMASMSEDQFKDWLVEQAAALELDEARFVETMGSSAVTEKVDQAQQHGLAIGIPGTPFLLINGIPYQGPRDLASLESILGLLKMEAHQFTFCPPMVIDPNKEYTATLRTEKGDVLIQLFPDKALLTVNSFVFLAREGWFDNITFHRVMPGFVAQTGDPSGTGMGSPGYYFKNEINDLKFDKAGMVGMANSGPDANGSQFFVTFQATPDLDGSYTIFGEVIDGMDVLEDLTPRDPSQAMGLPPGDTILSIEIKEK